MLLLITGANGFLGRATVAAAVRAGHAVRAWVRDAASVQPSPWPGAQVDVRSGALSDAAALASALSGCDAVLHVAAAKSGSYAEQVAGTVEATRQLLAAMDRSGVRRLVAVGSMSIHDYSLPGEIVNDDTPAAREPSRRDGYMQVKLLQEQLVRDWSARGGQATIVRPGIIYGPGALWSFTLGQPLGARGWLAVRRGGELPLVYLDNCADALVAALQPAAVGATVNVVDDERPSPEAFLAAINRMPGGGRTLVPLPLPVLRAAAVVASGLNRTLFGGRLPLPGLLVPERVDARFRPLRYDNARAKQALGWRPAVGLPEALRRSA